MSRLNCITLRCSYNNSLPSSFCLGFIQYYLSRDCNDYTGFQPLPVSVNLVSHWALKQSTFSRSLLKSMAYASEFRSLFRGATQKRLRNGLRAISYAAELW